jgi:uncharacterized protein
MRYIHAIIFPGIILFLSFVLNFYVLWRLCGLFAIKRGLPFWIIVFICSMSLVLAVMLQFRFENIFAKIYYIAATNWYGVMFVSFSTLIVYEIVRQFIKINPAAAGTGIIIIAACISAYSMINTQLLQVKELTIDGNTNCKIVQLSDIHIGSVSGNFLKEIIEKTNLLNPDLILITGDIVDNFNENTQEAIATFRNFKAPVMFSIGNHEMYVGAERVTEALRAANVTVLRNQMKDFGQIRIIGIDNGTSKTKIAQILGELNTDRSKFCILMYHQPTSLKMLSDAKVNLTLSGHTHYGQIFPFNFVVGLFYPYVSGFHKYDGGNLYITSGAGTWGPRMRLGSRSEIVSIQIRKHP